MKCQSSKILWHRFLARMFEELLTPLNVSVTVDFSVMTNPPEGDILLIRRDTSRWTSEQRECLPDGIRDTNADHVLIEFKYTESVNRNAVTQALGYDTFFRRTHSALDSRRIRTFILSAKTPSKATRKGLGFTEALKPGVYGSRHYLIDEMTLICINDLSDAPHNDFVKCFASRKQERTKAFQKLLGSRYEGLSSAVFHLLGGILQLFIGKEKGGIVMEKEITPDFVMEIGKEMYEAMLSGIRLKDVISRFDPEEIVKQFAPEDIFKQFAPEDIFKQFAPEDILSRMDPKEIEAYLNKIKHQ